MRTGTIRKPQRDVYLVGAAMTPMRGHYLDKTYVGLMQSAGREFCEHMGPSFHMGMPTIVNTATYNDGFSGLYIGFSQGPSVLGTHLAEHDRSEAGGQSGFAGAARLFDAIAGGRHDLGVHLGVEKSTDCYDPHTGTATPAVVLFPPMNMFGKAPYGHGHVLLTDATITGSTAMLFPIRSTKGPVRDGIFSAAEPVKVVFMRDRDGWITDVFVVPQKELAAEQVMKSPLFVDEIDWSGLKVKPVFDPVTTYEESMLDIFMAMTAFCDRVNSSSKAREILARNDFTINVHTAGGDFCIMVRTGTIAISIDLPESPTTEFAIADPQVFFDWVNGGGIIDAVAEGALWFPARGESEGGQFEIAFITDLDRLHRAAMRDGAISA